MPETQEQTDNRSELAPRDELAQLAADLDKEGKRALKCDDHETLRDFVGRTVMPSLRDLAKQVIELRNWAGYAHNAHANHLDNHEDRVAYLEAATFDAGNEQLTQDTWTTLQRVAIALDVFLEEAMKSTSDPEGRKKLEEQGEMSKRALSMLEDVAILDDDDGDDGDGDSDDDQH